MRPSPPQNRRFRRCLGGAAAGLAVATLLMAALFFASLRWAFFVQTHWISVEAMGGLLELHRGGAPAASVTRHFWPLRRVVRFDLDGPGWQIKLPLYYPLAGLAFAAAATGAPVIYTRGRRRPGCCRTCGYDLAGAPPGAPCPECGPERAHG